jgi:hypothetical protein
MTNHYTEEITAVTFNDGYKFINTFNRYLKEHISIKQAEDKETKDLLRETLANQLDMYFKC